MHQITDQDARKERIWSLKQVPGEAIERKVGIKRKIKEDELEIGQYILDVQSKLRQADEMAQRLMTIKSVVQPCAREVPPDDTQLHDRLHHYF